MLESLMTIARKLAMHAEGARSGSDMWADRHEEPRRITANGDGKGQVPTCLTKLRILITEWEKTVEFDAFGKP